MSLLHAEVWHSLLRKPLLATPFESATMVVWIFSSECCQPLLSYPSDRSCGQFSLCVLVRCRLTGQKLLDFIGGSRVATRRVNQQSQIVGIDRLQPEKIKAQFSGTRMMHRFPSLRHVVYIVTGP